MGSIQLKACNVINTRLAHSQELLVLTKALLLVDHNYVTHEAQESFRVSGRRDGRDPRAVSENRILREVLKLLVHVEVLQVVNDANVVDESAAC